MLSTKKKKIVKIYIMWYNINVSPKGYRNSKKYAIKTATNCGRKR